MYLLYADDSGVASDPNAKYSVLAGFATYENQTYWIQKEIDTIMEKYLGRADIELHASPIRSGKGFWRSVPKQTRESLLSMGILLEGFVFLISQKWKINTRTGHEYTKR